jgi:hypothetical protein
VIIDPKNWQSLIGNSQLPIWRVHDQIFYHKLSAILSTTDVGMIKYDCFHSSLDAINWSIEPSETYQELCRQRAREIRDSHDWVRLWYSGGADSHTALMSFYHAGCAPDEVITMRWSGMTQQGNPVNIETDQLVTPLLGQLQEMFPRTRFRTIEYHNDWFQRNMNQDWYLYMFKHEFNAMFARNISVSHDIDPQLLDAYQKYATVANVTGEPKPNILHRNGEWWATIIDSQIAGMHGVPGLQMFHLSPSAPDLFVKQCHMLKKAFQQKTHGLDEKQIWQLNHDLTSKNLALERGNEFDLNNISWLQWQHGKLFDQHGDHGFNVMAQRFLDHSNGFYYDHYRKLLDRELWSQKSQFFNTGNIVKNSTGIFSHFWSLDQHKVSTVDDLFPQGFDL